MYYLLPPLSIAHSKLFSLVCPLCHKSFSGKDRTESLCSFICLHVSISLCSPKLFGLFASALFAFDSIVFAPELCSSRQRIFTHGLLELGHFQLCYETCHASQVMQRSTDITNLIVSSQQFQHKDRAGNIRVPGVKLSVSFGANHAGCCFILNLKLQYKGNIGI